MRKMLALLAALLLSQAAYAQGVGQLGSGQLWGNATVARAPASPTTVTAILDRALTGVQGCVLNRNSTIFVCTRTPTLGLAGTAAGTLIFENATSGSITLTPPTGALGTRVLTWPLATDTLVGKATTDTFTNKTFDTAGTGNSFSINSLAATANTGTGAVARAAAPTFTAPVLGVASATSLALSGTGGAGFVSLLTQSSPPSAPASGFGIYADSTGRFSWIRQSDGFTRTWDATLTANRVYTLPDATTTIAGLSVAQTWTATQAFAAISATSASMGGVISWTTGLGAINHLTGPSDQPFAQVATAPVQAASTVAGNAFNITAANATAGSSNAGAAAGGAVAITAGNAARLTSGNAVGGAITLTGGTAIGNLAGGAINLVGGSPSATTTSTGGAVNLTAASGSTSATNATIGGGAIALLAGGGNYSSIVSTPAGAGGALSLTSGLGGNNTAVGGTGANAGALTITSGAGGSATGASGTRTGGNSGAVTIASGAVGTGASANGTAGNINIAPGGSNVLVASTAGIAVTGTGSVSGTLTFGTGTITALTNKASPNSTDDYVIIFDNAGAAVKKATVGSVGAAGAVSSIAGNTGAFTLTQPINNATNAILLNMPVLPQGRLTLTSNVPVLTASVTAATTVYYTFYSGNVVPLYDGTNTIPTQFTELSAALGSNWATNSNYDWFIGSDSGTMRLCSGPDWTAGAVAGSATTRGTGAGSTDLSRTVGLLMNANSMTCRYNNTTTFTCAANRCLYVGSMRTGAAGQTNFIIGSAVTAAVLGVWNMYNRVNVAGVVTDTGSSYSYSSGTIRQANAGAGAYNQVSFITGLAEDLVSAFYTTNGITTAALSAEMRSGIGFNSTTAFTGPFANFNAPAVFATVGSPSVAQGLINFLGYNVISANEQGDTVNNNQWNARSANKLSVLLRM